MNINIIISSDNISAINNDMQTLDNIAKFYLKEVINSNAVQIFDLLNQKYLDLQKHSYSIEYIEEMVKQNRLDLFKIYLKYNIEISEDYFLYIQKYKNIDFIMYIINNLELTDNILYCLDTVYEIVNLNDSFWRNKLFSIHIPPNLRLFTLVYCKKMQLMKVKQYLDANIGELYSDINSVIVEYI